MHKVNERYTLSHLHSRTRLTSCKILFPVKVNLEAKDGMDAAAVARDLEWWLQMDRDLALTSAVDISLATGNST